MNTVAQLIEWLMVILLMFVLDLGFDIMFKSRVRLYGIDTPESRTRNKDEKVRGKMAGSFLKDAVDNGTK